MVTADGEVVQASEDSEPDLFWAIRGGEGNFGVATRFQLRLHEISEIVGGMLILPATPEVITGFLEAAEAAPEELSTIANVMLAPPMPFIPEEAHGKPMLMGLMAYVGPVDQGDERDRALPRARRALRRHGAADALPGALRGPGAGGAASRPATNFFADSLEPAGAEAILEQLPKSTAMMKAVQLRVLGGALGRVPNDATAFGHRDRGLFVNVAAMYADAGEKETHDAWVERARATPSARTARAATSASWATRTRRRSARPTRAENWDRLRELKRRYDPDNLFRLNHNIPPAWRRRVSPPGRRASPRSALSQGDGERDARAQRGGDEHAAQARAGDAPGASRAPVAAAASGACAGGSQRKWMPKTPAQTMKQTLWRKRSGRTCARAASSQTPVAKTPTVVTTRTGASSRIGSAGGPFLR